MVVHFASGFVPEDDILRDSRGWCVRHGRRQRLATPKRGKAALRAEIQGQGQEVFRGRSAFKRSAKTGCRWGSPEYRGRYGSDFDRKVRRCKLRKSTQCDALEALETLAEEESLFAEEEQQDDDDGSLEEPSDDNIGDSASDIAEEERWTSLSETDVSWPDFDSVVTTRSTQASMEEPGGRMCCLPAEVPLRRDEACTPTRWHLAVSRAEVVAAEYWLELREKVSHVQDAPQGGQRKSKVAHRIRPSKPCSLEDQLLKLYNTHLCCRSHVVTSANREAQVPTSRFEKFCWKFMESHGKQVCQSLQSCLQGPVQLSMAPLDPAVQHSFMESCDGSLAGTLIPTFHGTVQRNLQSIYKHGLLIPGVDNDLRIVNGSAHGVGIYSAHIRNPGLALGFCRGSETLLVCGVLDDSKSISGSSLGTPGEIRHVGDAVVTFNAKRIAPLFVATRLPFDADPECLARCRLVACSRRTRQARGPKTRFAANLTRRNAEAFLLRRGARRRRQ